ncbi:MAG: HIT family protein [Planctomycetes bacterium]|nr:HIT family protein [Planctomycetota bacterium]
MTTQSTQPDCVFCRIVAGELPSHEVYSDDHVFAFLDIGPVAAGHLLLIPKTHCQNIVDLPADVASALGGVLPSMARAVVDVAGASGVNILQNNGACAGQVVDHVHFHLIPRTDDDGLGFRWRVGGYEAGEAEALGQKFRENLSQK